MPHRGASTQHHNQQVLAKPHHQPSNRDQQTREKLKQKAKIKSRAYIQLGEEALQTVHRTFTPDIPVIFHLPALIIIIIIYFPSRTCISTNIYKAFHLVVISYS